MPDDLSRFFFAMADPTRRSVIEQLTSGPATVSDLAAPHPIAMPTFLRHLRVLEDSGIVRTVKKGRVRTCQIEADALVPGQGWLAWQRAAWEGRNDRIAALAETLEETHER